MTIYAINRYIYFSTFTNDYSGYDYVYLMKHKFEHLKYLKN